MRSYIRSIILFLRSSTQRSARDYGFAYLACIPIFALIFCLSPNGFHHATLDYEYTTQNRLRNLERSLRVDFERVFTEEGFRKTYNGASRDVKFPDRIGDVSVQLDGSYLFVSLQYLDRVPLARNFQNPKAANYRFEGSIIELRMRPMQPELKFIQSDNFYGPSFTIELNDDERFRGTREELFLNSEGWMPISNNSARAYYDMVQIKNGRPVDNFIEHYLRMFYLSAVTITTLGYGDIVPINLYTRLIISIESILGIILIGLFLNSIARSTLG